MKITRVETIQLANIPIKPPPFRKEPSQASVGILEIGTDDGLVGYGILRDDMDGFITHRAAEFLKGKNPLLTDQLWHEMFTQFVSKGSSPYASSLAAIDIALWDLKGKALGVPIWRLLGGAQNRVQAYVSFGVSGPNTSGPGELYSREELAAEAKYLADQGHNKLKTVVGRADIPDPETDADRMMAIREAVGPDVKLMMDAACRMPLQDALRLCKLCEPLGVIFFEEPVYHNDPRLLAELRRQTTIALGANPRGYRWQYLELLLHGGADFIQPNVAQIGYTESWKIAEMVKAFNHQIINGNGGGPHNLHLQAGMSNGWGVEYHYHNWMMYQAVFQDLPGPEHGWVTAPDTPGAGLDPKPDIMKDYKVSAT